MHFKNFVIFLGSPNLRKTSPNEATDTWGACRVLNIFFCDTHHFYNFLLLLLVQSYYNMCHVCFIPSWRYRTTSYYVLHFQCALKAFNWIKSINQCWFLFLFFHKIESEPIMPQKSPKKENTWNIFYKSSQIGFLKNIYIFHIKVHTKKKGTEVRVGETDIPSNYKIPWNFPVLAALTVFKAQSGWKYSSMHVCLFQDSANTSWTEQSQHEGQSIITLHEVFTEGSDQPTVNRYYTKASKTEMENIWVGSTITQFISTGERKCRWEETLYVAKFKPHTYQELCFDLHWKKIKGAGPPG